MRYASLALVLTIALLGAPWAPRVALAQHAPLNLGRIPAGLGRGDSARCEPCHAEIVREWRGSMHAQSFTNDVFARSYAFEAGDAAVFCRNCHAPLNGGREPEGLAADEGIACSVCHVRDGHVLGATPPLGANDPTLHPIRVDTAIATSAACANCHQFDFPLGTDDGRRETMQNTLREWEASTAHERGESCQSCHMPRVETQGRAHHRHDFPGIHDATFLQSAFVLDVAARRDGRVVRVTASVRPGMVGHGFPTGDLFRRVEITVWLEHGNAPAQTFALERTYELRRGHAFDGSIASVRRPHSDTRLEPPGATPAPRVYAVAFPDTAASTAVGFRVEYLRMPDRQAAVQGVARASNHVFGRTGSVPITEGRR